MKVSISVLPLFGLLLASGAAHAAIWVEIARSDVSVIYADVESLSRVGPTVEIWAKYVHSVPQEVLGKPSKSARLLWNFNCEQRTAAVLRSVEYADIDGHDVIQALSAKSEPAQIKPGSVNDTIATNLCALPHSSKSQKAPPVVLVCPVSDGEGETKFDFTVTLDYRTSTANGWPADVSDTRVFWATDTNVYSLNRYSGSISFGSKSFPALFNGQCERKTEKLF